jgi:hypothetical protein
MKILFTVDDVCPAFPIEPLELLHEYLGLKFECFIPTNYHKENTLTKEWITSLDRSYVHINAHGHEHKSLDGSSREYRTLNHVELAERINTSLEVFSSLGVDINGIKAPGWDASYCYREVLMQFPSISYIYLNKREPFPKTKEIGYTYSVHENFTLAPELPAITLHSHIHPTCGPNGLTNELCMKLVHVLKSHLIEPVFASEVV